jgi:hypothetical protein
MSRDSYKWNVAAVKKHLQKQGMMPMAAWFACNAFYGAYEQGLNQ